MKVQIQHQQRQSLAMKVTPHGVVVLLPHGLDAGSQRVQAFIAEGLRKLGPPQAAPAGEPVSKADLLAMVEEWAGRLGVAVQRVQVQPLRTKWGSISTAGNLTLASDLTRLPRRLVEYVICHELLHLHVPHHNRVYYLLLSRHIPDWRERELELGRWTLVIGPGGKGKLP